MEWIEVRVNFPSKQRVPQMSRVMGKRIESRIAPHQPARNEIDGQRKPIHLDEQRNDKSREGTKGAPIPFCLRFREAESENDEDRGVDNDKRPQSVRGRLFHLSSSKNSWISDDLYVARPHRRDLHALHETSAVIEFNLHPTSAHHPGGFAHV